MLNLSALICALMIVESGGESHPDSAIGDNGASVGILQIQKPVVDDLNRILKRNVYSYSDRTNAVLSVAMCEAYISYWADRYQKRTGKTPTLEVCAKIWNGGPYADRKTGKAKEKLDYYWMKVQREMRKK